ncbi:exosortase Y-associated Wzy-like protein [Mucilaginibacter ximonensis]|uniref:Exosortase Y-associated Wzy-like protein n=1 Tax=Mucilaginibacter ximonensis TaxID=538021 RepID=A0ABW5YEM3_9SPHI
MNRNFVFEKFILLYLPWIISLIFASQPTVSYFIAWSGSFFIFFMTLTGQIVPLPDDRSFANQIMRPVILVQIIFAGYMCCTSIFYFMSLLGYNNFESTPFFLPDPYKLELAAKCQRYYCLGHAAMISGILMVMRYPQQPKYKVQPEKLSKMLYYATILSFPMSVIFLKIDGLAQFANQFSSLSFMASALGLAFAIPQKKVLNIIVCFIFYALNFYSAMVSGFKEPIILSVMVLGLFLYPVYKRIVLLIFIPVMLLLFLVLPTYVSVIRQNSWGGGQNASDATSEALDAAINQGANADEGTWYFLVNRLSEIDMFSGYIESTPEKIGYYHLALVEQSITVLVPRIFWPSKPVTEQLVMKRVYDSGVINPFSTVSAKPAFIVDAYLSWGGLGVFVFLFLYGVAAQSISQKAEWLFGGYTLGTALVFSGLFQIFWRGLSFEFILNNVVWGYISMLILAHILRRARIIELA